MVFYYLIELKKKNFEIISNLYDNLHYLSSRVVPFSLWTYSVFPLKTVDLLLWLSFSLEKENVLADILSDISKSLYKLKEIEIKDILWGFTKPSVYSKASKSSQEINPFENNRKKYLIVYPFVKTAEWYLLKQDTRQGMMNEHIRIGKQYPSILQLLLYSFGLNDYEFLVTYETDSLIEFEELVYNLRFSEARKYTLKDTPIYVAVYRNLEELKKIFLSNK
ncbi:MAG: chlorite dismutase family protein [Candidatus Methanomethylicia archaeon]